MDSLDDRLRELVEQFSDDDRIRTLWLFGSRARDETTPLSDIDLAVWFDGEPTLEERAELQSTAMKTLRRDDVDLVFIEEADPVLAYRIVTDGRRLFARDPDATDRFAQKSIMHYLDTAHLRRRVQRLQREALE